MHTLPLDEQRALCERYVVPTPGKVYVQGARAPITDTMAVDFKNAKRAPLLLIAGEEDRTVTAGMVRATYEKQKKSGAPTELRSFPGKTHWIIGQDGWEEIAALTLDWAAKATTPAP